MATPTSTQPLKASLTQQGLRTFGTALVFFREERGLDHQAVAKRIPRTSPDDVRAWENNESRPDGSQREVLFSTFPRLRHFKHLMTPIQQPVVRASATVTPTPPPVVAAPAPEAPKVEKAELPERPARTFPEAIRALRTRDKLTMQDLGKLLGVDDSSVSQWENGKMVPVRKHHAALISLWPELSRYRVKAKDIGKPGRAPGSTVVNGRVIAPGAKLDQETAAELKELSKEQPAPQVSQYEALGLAYGRARQQLKDARQVVVELETKLMAAHQDVDKAQVEADAARAKLEAE